MTHEELEQYQKELLAIMSGSKKDPAKSKEIQLRELAAKLGVNQEPYVNDYEAQLIANIQAALQTASMIDMCGTANKNYSNRSQ